MTSFFHTSSVDNVLYECESVTIVCEVRDCSPPIKNISIYHENRLVYRRTNTFNGRKSVRNKMDTPGSAGQLRLKQVRKKDEGIYYCIAENENGSSRKKTIQLKVICKYYDGNHLLFLMLALLNLFMVSFSCSEKLRAKAKS